MKNTLIILSVLLFTSTSLNAQNIPITTKSKEALDYYKKGWQLEDQLKLDEAEKMYNKAVNTDSTFALAYLRLAMVKDNYDVRRKQLIEAEKYIDNVTESEKLWIRGRLDFYAKGYDGSKEYGYFKKLVELYPNDEMANFLFAFVNLHHRVLKPDLAISHFEKAIKINPKFIKPYNELIYAYLENKNYKNAKRIAENYIEILPTSVNPLDTYAEIFMRSGEYEKSIENYKKVLKIDPQFPWALMGITANMNFLGKHEEGRNYTIRLEENHLTHYEYRHKWKSLVTSYLDEGDFKQAIATLENQKLESVSGRNKREPSFHMYFSFLRKTRFYFENNQSKQGLLEYKEWYKYINQSDRSQKAKTRIKNLENYYLAYAAYLDNKLKDARMYLNNYTASNEGETDASKILSSRILLAKEQTEKAINKILETDLNSPYNQYWLMIAYKKAGDTKNAKKYRNKILSLNDRNNINLSLVRKKTLHLKLSED